jgi:hypothetical protein
LAFRYARIVALLVLVSALAPSAAQAQREGPTNLQLTPGAGTIATSWGVSSTKELIGFRVRWKKVDGGDNGRVELPRSARSYTIGHLRHIRYEVIVRALYKEGGGGAATGEVTPQPSLDEPPEEETPVEEPPEEEPGTGGGEAGGGEEEVPEEEAPQEPGAVSVSGTPTGPPTPAGGWVVEYADGFGAPLGNGPGQDNTWFPNNCALMTNCHNFGNSDEMEVFNPSAVSVGREGLRLTCTYNVVAQQPGGEHFVCGTVRGQAEGNMAGYSFFKWAPGKGQTLVFQAVAKFPPNTGEADPGWWSNGPPWNDTEVDFFEGGGASASYTTGWRTNPMYTAWFAAPHPNANKPGFAEDPSLAFHTYTFEITPRNTYSIWIDGVPQSWATNVGPVEPDLAEKATLILSYGLRECRCISGFTSGTREFDVRSVAVYEDKAHQGVGIENAAVVPGTTIG